MVVSSAIRLRRARRPLAAAACALAAAAVLAGCSTTTGGAGNTGFVAETTGISDVAAAQRVAAPDLSGTTLTGQKFALSQDRGHYVVVNVWGSWCTPCREEGPALEETYQKFQAKGVDFMGINTRDDNDAALAYVAQEGITYPSLQDPDETLVLEFKAILPPTTVPSTVIIDPQGRVAVRILGAVTEPQLVQQLNSLLSQA
jgi:peroxiredoxin